MRSLFPRLALLAAVPLLAAGCSTTSAAPETTTAFSEDQLRNAFAQRVGEDAAADVNLADTTKATLKDARGAEVGEVVFWRPAGQESTVVLTRLQAPEQAPGSSFHGFHVHANDDASNGEGCQADPQAAPTEWFASADGHFAGAEGAQHGDHSGDMPALYLDGDRRVDTSFSVDRFAPADLVGKAVVLHVGPDNFGNVPTGTEPNQYTANSDEATSLTERTGNAGNRLACGVVAANEG